MTTATNPTNPNTRYRIIEPSDYRYITTECSVSAARLLHAYTYSMLLIGSKQAARDCCICSSACSMLSIDRMARASVWLHRPVALILSDGLPRITVWCCLTLLSDMTAVLDGWYGIKMLSKLLLVSHGAVATGVVWSIHLLQIPFACLCQKLAKSDSIWQLSHEKLTFMLRHSVDVMLGGTACIVHRMQIGSKKLGNF